MTPTNWSSIDRQIARRRANIRRVLSAVVVVGRPSEPSQPPTERTGPEAPRPGSGTSDPFAPPPQPGG